MPSTIDPAPLLGPHHHRAVRLRVLLIRHGESSSNVENTVTGERTCRGLTDRGHRQARALAHRLALEQHHLRITAVYSTAVRRALDTAQPIVDALGLPLLPTLPYTEYGTAEGRQRVRSTSTSPDAPLAPGADSWAIQATRVAKALDILTDRHRDGTIALVCHRETIIAASQHFQRVVPTLHYATADVEYTAITEWSRRARSTDPRHTRWAMIRHNDYHHLL